MNHLRDEVERNFGRFFSRLSTDWQNTSSALNAKRSVYQDSYFRMVSLQAWRSVLLEPQISPGSLGFFLEAQNDVLTSHALARFGMWRSALKSLRSCIENSFFCLYYMDHPVELRLWHEGKHRLPFSQAVEYVSRHPDVSGIPSKVTGLAIVKKEYSTLSKAVHGSAASFRMTVRGTSTLLFSDDAKNLSMWVTRERQVLVSANLVLLTMFRRHLSGARLPALRKSISLVVPRAKHADVKQHLKVTLYSS